MQCPYCGKGALVKIMVRPFQEAGWYQCFSCLTHNPLRIFKEQEAHKQERDLWQKRGD